jgi:hypothetical protein
MTTWTKERGDNSEGCEEALGVPGGLETAHSTLSLPHRLMGILSAIVRALVVYVNHIGQYFDLGSSVTAKFVGDDDPRYVLQSSQQLPKELLRSLSVATWLHEDIEYLAVLIDSATQILQLATDREADFIEMPAIPGPALLEIAAAWRRLRQTSVTNRNGLVGHDNPSLSHKFLQGSGGESTRVSIRSRGILSDRRVNLTMPRCPLSHECPHEVVLEAAFT